MVLYFWFWSFFFPTSWFIFALQPTKAGNCCVGAGNTGEEGNVGIPHPSLALLFLLCRQTGNISGQLGSSPVALSLWTLCLMLLRWQWSPVPSPVVLEEASAGRLTWGWQAQNVPISAVCWGIEWFSLGCCWLTRGKKITAIQPLLVRCWPCAVWLL